MAGLSDDLRAVVGGATAKALAQHFEMRTVADLLRHYPRRYQPHRDLTDFAGLEIGAHVTVLAEVRSAREVPFVRRSGRSAGHRALRTEVVITDGWRQLDLVFFLGRNNRGWRAASFPAGARGMFTGTVGTFRGRHQLTHPEVRLFDGAAPAEAWERRDLIPIYPATNAYNSLKIAQAVDMALVALDPVPDPVDAALLDRSALLDLDSALHLIHQPDSMSDVTAARRRLAYDEALDLQVALALRRRRTEGFGSTARPLRPAGLLAAFDARSGLTLTPGQTEVGAVIAADLQSSRPMHRLLQGDVGSGKTLVALRAMLQVVDAGGQAAMLAPTEVLAQQHRASLTHLLGELGQGGMLGAADQATGIALLTGSVAGAARREALQRIASGEAGLVVGTHALLQESVQYADLGLIVVDEQHRFGVEQRSALLERIPGTHPHLLVMGATPIPRTVAMTVFGDLEVTTLHGRPGGAPQVLTHVVSEPRQPAHMLRAWQRAREEVEAGRPVFVVCTRIDEADAGDTTDAGPEPATLDDETWTPPEPHAVTALAEELTAGPLRGVRLGVLHGRMTPDDKAATMDAFASGPGDPAGLDVLVSTTVIEVGVDVPAAAMMIIMDADRFGVSQVHQLRGRVGRLGQPALCLLVTSVPEDSHAHERLTAIAATNDGFALSLLDLRERREGDVLGAEQSGRRSSLRILSVLDDEALIEQARGDAAELLAADPELGAHALLAERVRALTESERAQYLERA